MGNVGGDTDVFILRIYAVGERCAGAGQNYASLLAQRNDALCTALLVEGDEVTALGVGPVGDAQVSQFLFQGVFYDLELRSDERLVLFMCSTRFSNLPPKKRR